MSKGTRYQTLARKMLIAEGAMNVLTTGGTGYKGGVDLLAFFDYTSVIEYLSSPPRVVALQIKACHQDRAGRSGAANQALREGITEIRAEPLPAWVERQVWVFRRGEVIKRTVEGKK